MTNILMNMITTMMMEGMMNTVNIRNKERSHDMNILNEHYNIMLPLKLRWRL